MDDPKSLETLFTTKIFRIPDYQRGYAWRQEQLKDFWEDLINLSRDRSHYTGLLTLKQIPAQETKRSDKEYWLVEDYSYALYHVVDGQQRLTTFIILVQAFLDFFRALPENSGKEDSVIYVTENLNVTDLQSRYLFRIKPTGDQFRTYIFGYESDNPSHNYLRFRIFDEIGGRRIDETFYTLNLRNARIYFTAQLHELYKQEGLRGIQDIYRKLTKQFLFNEYVIKDEFDVFVAFETMNNRGKKLSDLELLKNRLIYLTTLYDDLGLDDASRKSLRDGINDAWKEVYHQLGRNKLRPLNDNDFLRAHWIMYFKYSRMTGRDYIRFLLDEQFTPKRVHKKVEQEVFLEGPQEMRSEQEPDDVEDNNGDLADGSPNGTVVHLEPTEIRDFIVSLKESAIHWFNSFYPDLAEDISVEEQQWLERLNRIGIGYFRPLVMAILKNEKSDVVRIAIFQRIERFIFIHFRMNSVNANSGSSEFYNAARTLDSANNTTDAIEEIVERLDNRLAYTFNRDDGTFLINSFYNNALNRFKWGSGYYSWFGLRYFLFEYETNLLKESRQTKVEWNDLLRGDRDKISIEHVYPQTETASWDAVFTNVKKEHRKFFNGSLGNLLLLSMAINASLQNDSFDQKKRARFDPPGKKIRNGYADGSHSEIEVAQYESWGPDEIRARGIKLLRFMEERWDIRFKNDAEREKLLFIDFDNSGA